MMCRVNPQIIGLRVGGGQSDVPITSKPDKHYLLSAWGSTYSHPFLSTPKRLGTSFGRPWDDSVAEATSRGRADLPQPSQ